MAPKDNIKQLRNGYGKSEKLFDNLKFFLDEKFLLKSEKSRKTLKDVTGNKKILVRDMKSVKTMPDFDSTQILEIHSPPRQIVGQPP